MVTLGGGGGGGRGGLILPVPGYCPTDMNLCMLFDGQSQKIPFWNLRNMPITLREYS